MAQIISRQEPVKRVLQKKTLHEWMCFEAETVVKHNWTDVACHDHRILKKMLPGETRLWIIHEMGSVLLPMYCRLNQKSLNDLDYSFSSVEVYLLRFAKEDSLGNAQNRIIRSTSSFYFISKGVSRHDYSVVPTDFIGAMDLVFCGKASLYLN